MYENIFKDKNIRLNTMPKKLGHKTLALVATPLAGQYVFDYICDMNG